MSDNKKQKPSKEQQLYDVLKRISQYDPVEKIQRYAENSFGIDPSEAVEMAYENVIAEAKFAIRGMRRPK